MLPEDEEDDHTKTIRLSHSGRDPGAPEHYLSVVEGGVERSVLLTREPLILGRDPSRGFHLPDAGVSWSHCEVRLVASLVLVTDLGSTNGTVVDGKVISDESVLAPSALLQVGPFALRHELLTVEEAARRNELASDLARARSYVQELIPPPLELGRCRTEWCFVPSSVLGGDGLGYQELDGDYLMLYVIDVCGHGTGSALHSASVLNAMRGRALPADFEDPSSVLGQLALAFSMEEHSGMFFTMWYGVLERATGRLRFASAGHPPAVLLGADGRIRERLATSNPPVGTVTGRSVAQAETCLEQGDRLFVFTDGVYEFEDREGRPGRLADFERALEGSGSDRSPGGPRRLYEAAVSAAAAPLEDDFTLLMLGWG